MPSPGEECRIAPWRRFMASVELYSSCRKEIDKWFSNIMLEDTAFPNLIQVLHVQQSVPTISPERHCYDSYAECTMQHMVNSTHTWDEH
jgi:hypothetical protein